MKKVICSVAMLFVATAVLVVVAARAQNAAGQRSSVKKIKIDSIKENDKIKGKVSGFADPQNYKVLVYVHTDVWYIHPYAGQDEGLSWAAIKEDGTWSITTVNRKFKANRVAALAVDPSVAKNAPAKLENVASITHHALIVYTKEEMKQKGWYGKL